MEKNKVYSPFRDFLRKFSKQKLAVIAFSVVIAIVIIALFGSWLAPFDPSQPVTYQYEKKGIQVTQQNETKVTVWATTNTDQKERVTDLKITNTKRNVTAIRFHEEQLTVQAKNTGVAQIKLSKDNISTVIQVEVSESAAPVLSYLEVSSPTSSLQIEDVFSLEVTGMLTDGTTVDSNQIEQLTKEDNLKTSKNDGFNTSSTSQMSPKGGIVFESFDPNVASVDNRGNIKALQAGSTIIKVTAGEVSTIIPVFVETVPTASVVNLIPEQTSVLLSTSFKHQEPSNLHWFGTDHQNRDIFSRVLVGTQQTLIIGFVSVLVGASIGTILGLMAGYYGGRVDSLITRFTDLLLAFPGILLAIAVIAILGAGIVNIIFAVATFTVPIFIRIVRGSTLSLKEKTYVEAARSIGVSDLIIIFRHILPGTFSIVLVYLTMRVGTAILIGASLSFLGLGGDITAPEWGAMLSAAKDNSRTVFYPTFFPGMAIVVTVLAFNIFGDGLRDALDPKLKD
ncbi:ABC transporter permease subunit [Bacillus sp. HMF5848]|uniref:ABC transporter permease n=1 Tax=Bacillus sp. HMF5848 TaxID=2495421 RepID=UPI000F7B6EA7|nr:ABC transporter permease subunit [Bacillus sp. HMF5848]RSK27183.1 ABC transporter permease subunit [Bacillus sp. HMF5848]